MQNEKVEAIMASAALIVQQIHDRKGTKTFFTIKDGKSNLSFPF